MIYYLHKLNMCAMELQGSVYSFLVTSNMLFRLDLYDSGSYADCAVQIRLSFVEIRLILNLYDLITIYKLIYLSPIIFKYIRLSPKRYQRTSMIVYDYL